MPRILNARERKALDILSLDRLEFQTKNQLSTGIGFVTLEALAALGLVEKQPSDRAPGELGYRITDNGWRAMYGKSYDEVIAELEKGAKPEPLAVWSWPPTMPHR